VYSDGTEVGVSHFSEAGYIPAVFRSYLSQDCHNLAALKMY
jgi:hypothetical protein